MRTWKPTQDRPKPYLTQPASAAELLPGGPLREALLKRDFQWLSQQDSRVARALAAWFQGHWIQAATEADLELLAHPTNTRVAELKRQISVQAPLFARKYPRPTLSACLIVRDSEATLEKALASIKELVQEIVVVDTGSVDGTRPIAEKYTDRIFSYGWTDDFAAARNETLKYATGDWILSIDSDEWLDASSVPVVQSMLHDDSCVYSPLYRTVGRGQSFCNPRLFPRRADARWSGALHEQIIFETWRPMAIPMTAFVIWTTAPDRPQRSARNLKIIESMKAGTPEERRLAMAYEAFESYGQEPESERTQQQLTAAIAAFGDEYSGTSRRCYRLLGAVLARRQQWEELRALATRADALGFGGLWSKYSLAKLALQAGDLETAAREARAGLEIRDFEGPVDEMRNQLQAILKAI